MQNTLYIPKNITACPVTFSMFLVLDIIRSCGRMANASSQTENDQNMPQTVNLAWKMRPKSREAAQMQQWLRESASASQLSLQGRRKRMTRMVAAVTPMNTKRIMLKQMEPQWFSSSMSEQREMKTTKYISWVRQERPITFFVARILTSSSRMEIRCIKSPMSWKISIQQYTASTTIPYHNYASRLTVLNTNYLPILEAASLLFFIFSTKSSMFYWLKAPLSLLQYFLELYTNTSTGYPNPLTPNTSSTSKWSPPCVHRNLNILPLCLSPTLLIRSRYISLSSTLESSMLGRKDMMHTLPTSLSHILLQWSSYTACEVISICQKVVAPPICSCAHSTMASRLRAPSYGMAESSFFWPGGKNLRVGYPLTPNFSADLLLVVASTFATFTSPLSAVASSAHTGAKLLQCPHHGAQNSTNHPFSSPYTILSNVESVNTITSSSPLSSPLSSLAPPPPNLFFAVCLSVVSMKSTKAEASLPPPYSVLTPSTQSLRVGYPLMSTPVCSVDASMAARLAMPFNAPAAFSYQGARRWQCPHQLAQNQTNQMPVFTLEKEEEVSSWTAVLPSYKASARTTTIIRRSVPFIHTCINIYEYVLYEHILYEYVYMSMYK